jgi:mRNA-degrading endonuclease RelE of RelBE toxin-antitoxin system
MKHFASPAFWQHYRKLPENIRELADKNFKLLKQNSNHPSLHLKKVSQFWSVRVGRKYRALAVQVEEGLIWFWIGTHSEYDKLVRS